jgi:hypothetical protein
MNGISELKQLLALKCSNGKEKQDEINQRIEQVVCKATGELSIYESTKQTVNFFHFPKQR